eukprot:g16899.t1
MLEEFSRVLRSNGTMAFLLNLPAEEALKASLAGWRTCRCPFALTHHTVGVLLLAWKVGDRSLDWCGPRSARLDFTGPQRLERTPMKSEARKYGSWGKGPDVPPPPRVELLVEPANTIFLRKIKWEVQSRGNAPFAIERWLASMPSRHVPYATLGHHVIGEPGSTPPALEDRFWRMDLAALVQRSREEHTQERVRSALWARTEARMMRPISTGDLRT